METIVKKELTGAPEELPVKPDTATSDDIRQNIAGLDEDLKNPPFPPEETDGKGEIKDPPNLTQKLRRDLDAANKKIREFEKSREAAPAAAAPAAAAPAAAAPAAAAPAAAAPAAAAPAAAAPAAEVKQTPEQRLADNEKAFRIFERASRALGGEFVQGIDTPEKAKEVHALALDVIRSMTAEELVEIQQKAESGAFGEAGQIITDTIARELATALGKNHVEDTKLKREEQARTEQAKVIKSAMETVHTKYPALRPVEGLEQTPELKFAKGWFEKNVGTDKEPGIFFDAVGRDPTRNIPLLFDRMMDEFQASQHRAIIAERDGLRRRLGEEHNPEGANQPGSGGVPTGSAAVLQELRSRGVDFE